MSLPLLLACLCGAAARGAPNPRCLPETELEGYCRSRRLDGEAPLINGGEGLEPAPETARDLPGLNAKPHFSADGVFIANDVTIRRAVSLWSSNRTRSAAEETYGHISTWETGSVTNKPVKSRLFPETFEYVHKGLDGVEATSTHVLFGDLIAAVEETIDRDADDESARIKGFKPGTHAQRHRLHRIQHSRRASSRLADLTSMVRDSFRRVNVASEADSEKASPAAARPAARPQLSWRASAPEYGNFE